MSTQSNTSDNRQIARGATTVMAAIIFSQLVGLLAKSLAGSAYGTKAEMDAFFAANQFSDLLFNLVAAGALSSAFIPVFTTFLAKQQHAAAWKLASAVINLVSIILTLLSILTAIFAPQVVNTVLAPGFTDPAQKALTVDLLRIQLISTVIFGLSGITMAALNAHQSFLFPALAPSMYSFGWIFGVLVLRPSMGIYGLAWGTVIGAALHFLVQVPVMLRIPERKYHFRLALRDQAVREVTRLMGPRLLGVSIVQLNFLFNAYLASFLPEGSLASIKWAMTLMLMPQAAIAQSIAIASLPTFSVQIARGERDAMRSSLSATLRGVLLLAVPASVGLVVLRSPITALVFERIQFDEGSTAMVSWALLWYGVGLVGHSVVELISRAFYALHDTKTPVFVGIAAMTLNLVLSLLFAIGFARIGWLPHGGLALANSLATALEMVALLILMRRRLNGLHGKDLLSGLLKILAAALIMGLVLWAWLALTTGASVLLTALGGVALGGVVYGIMAYLLRIRELRQVLYAVLSRFRQA